MKIFEKISLMLAKKNEYLQRKKRGLDKKFFLCDNTSVDQKGKKIEKKGGWKNEKRGALKTTL